MLSRSSSVGYDTHGLKSRNHDDQSPFTVDAHLFHGEVMASSDAKESEDTVIHALERTILDVLAEIEAQWRKDTDQKRKLLDKEDVEVEGLLYRCDAI